MTPTVPASWLLVAMAGELPDTVPLAYYGLIAEITCVKPWWAAFRVLKFCSNLYHGGGAAAGRDHAEYKGEMLETRVVKSPTRRVGIATFGSMNHIGLERRM
jgi:hypothetical protein